MSTLGEAFEGELKFAPSHGVVGIAEPDPVKVRGAPRKALKKIKDTTEYYPHQTAGIREMARMRSFLLADEMGLGKTLQALTVAAIDFELNHAEQILVVCPASLKYNWQDEIELFTNFKCLVLDGTPVQRQKQMNEYENDPDQDILIVNYEQVTGHLSELNALDFDIVIVDEAHMIKGFKSKRSKAVRDLTATRFFLLTGSPLLNRPDELWALLHRIDPGGYPKYWSFVSRYCIFGGYQDKQVVGTKNQAELREKLHSVMIRRLKKDVLDLPDKQHIRVLVDLLPEQRKLYREAMEELRITLPDSPTPLEVENALTKFLHLKMICGTTACIPGYPDHSAKLDIAIDKIEEILTSGEKVVVFTQFRKIQECLRERLIKGKLGGPYELNGDVPKVDRQGIVRAWSTGVPIVRGWSGGENSENGVLSAMLQVAGVGLTLTAASKCIFLDKLFVPKLNEQAEDRLHRIGADLSQPVQIIELICRNTIEQRIETILRKKRKMFDETVETTSWRRELYASLTEDDDV